MRLVLNKDARSEASFGRAEWIQKFETPSGPVEHDGVVVETIVRDTISEDILANSKTSWPFKGIANARARSESLQIGEMHEKLSKKTFGSSGEKKLRGEAGAGLTRPRLANSLHSRDTSVDAVSLANR